jgi:hypothetical protein
MAPGLKICTTFFGLETRRNHSVSVGVVSSPSDDELDVEDEDDDEGTSSASSPLSATGRADSNGAGVQTLVRVAQDSPVSRIACHEISSVAKRLLAKEIRRNNLALVSAAVRTRSPAYN